MIHFFHKLSCVILQILVILSITGFTNQKQDADFTAFDMISAVNNIRAIKGLPPVQINSIIMAIAQDHSDYQASISRSSHAGRSGEIVIARVEASGYSGGRKFVAGENVAGLDVGITGMLPIIVNEIWSDPVHYGAMVNSKYTDAGVGIASDGKTVYVTLNLAGIVEEDGDKPADTASPELEDVEEPGINPNILPLFTTTPKPDGAVYHTVGFGQTLGTIARMYGVDMYDLANINSIEPDKIFVGQNIFIRYETPLTNTVTPEPTAISSATITPLSSLTPFPVLASTVIEFTPIPDVITDTDLRKIGVVVIFMVCSIFFVIFLYVRKLH